MLALLVYLSPRQAPSWLWLTLVSVALLPGLGWIAQSPKRRRFTVALLIALLGGASMSLWAAYPPNGVWDNCCQWLIPYGVCWPIEWC